MTNEVNDPARKSSAPKFSWRFRNRRWRLKRVEKQISGRRFFRSEPRSRRSLAGRELLAGTTERYFRDSGVAVPAACESTEKPRPGGSSEDSDCPAPTVEPEPWD